MAAEAVGDGERRLRRRRRPLTTATAAPNGEVGEI